MAPESGGAFVSVTQRRFTRLPLQSKVVITSKNRTFSASSLNLSIHGMFVQTREAIPVGETVEIDLLIPNVSCSPYMKLRAVVTRAEHSGIALEFERLDPETFQCLKNILFKRTSHRHKPYMGP
jgi:hypothetical protein